MRCNYERAFRIKKKKKKTYAWTWANEVEEGRIAAASKLKAA